jgi:hypothetical protein
MESQIFRRWLQGSKLIGLKIFAYIIEKFLKHKCLKWARMKNWQFDSWLLKIRIHHDSLAWRWCATYCWKSLDKGYNFASNLTSIGGLHTKLWASKVAGVQFQEFRNSNLGVLGQNDIWVLTPWLGTKNTIRGKVVVSYKSESWWVLWVWFVCGEFVHQKCSNYAPTNLLFGLCRSVWVIDLLVILPSPYPGVPAHPSTPKMLRTRERTPTPHFSAMFTLNSHLSLLRSLGVHQ